MTYRRIAHIAYRANKAHAPKRCVRRPRRVVHTNRLTRFLARCLLG